MRKRSSSDQATVGAVLARLPAARVLNSLKSPASNSRVDHLVIGPCGIFAIDVFHCTGTIKAYNDTLWLGSTDLRAECAAAQRKAGEVGTFMQHAVTPVLCFADAKLPAPVIHLRHVVVCTPGILGRYINGGPRCLDGGAVQHLADRASALAHEVPGTPLTAPPEPRLHVRQPSRSSATAPPGPAGFFGRRILATAAGTAVCIVVALALPAVARFTQGKVDQFVHAASYSKLDAAAPAEPSVTTATTIDPAVVSEGAAPAPDEPDDAVSDLLPQVDFTCPQQGAGWTASAVATELETDPVGYHLWYQTAGGPWQYWGQFKSGIEAPAGLPGLARDVALDIRMDRSFHPNAEGAPTMLTFTAPDTDC